LTVVVMVPLDVMTLQAFSTVDC